MMNVCHGRVRTAGNGAMRDDLRRDRVARLVLPPGKRVYVKPGK
jgi:hypothetical protein